MFKKWFFLFTANLNFISILWGLSSSSITLIWLSMEINLFSFTYMLVCESSLVWLAIKYLVIQGLGSLYLLASIAAGATALSPLLLEGALILKMAMAPLHFWFISTFGQSPWKMALLLSTSQKILPLMLLMFLGGPLSAWVIHLNLLWSVWGGFLCQTLKPLLAYSSLLTLSWVLLSSSSWGYAYLLIYAAALAILFLSLSESQQFSYAEKKKTNPLASFSVGLLTLAGVPPMASFGLKLVIITGLAGHWLSLFFLLTASAFYLYLYFIFGWTFFCATDFSLLGKPGPWKPVLQLASLPLILLLMVFLVF